MIMQPNRLFPENAVKLVPAWHGSISIWMVGRISWLVQVRAVHPLFFETTKEPLSLGIPGPNWPLRFHVTK
jgi:hypothetical protein